MSDQNPMRRTPGVTYEPDNQVDVHDFVLDYARDAIDAGLLPTDVVVGLEKAVLEIKEAQRCGEFSDDADLPKTGDKPEDYL